MNVDSVLSKLVENIINPLILLLFAVALIYFLWGVFVYIKNAEDSAKRIEGGKHILYGVIGLAIMIGVYGILNIVTSTLFGA